MVMVVVLAVIDARPAAAAPGLSLSLDRVHWSDTIDRELFDAQHTWAPGDEATVTLWVRNTSGVPADLRIDVVDTRGTLRLGRDVLLSAEVDGRRSAVDGHLATAAGVDGAPHRIDLTAQMPAGTGNDAQRRSVSLRLRVVLVGRLAPTSTPDRVITGADRLSATGSPTGVAVWIVGGLVLVVAGLVLSRRGRKV